MQDKPNPNLDPQKREIPAPPPDIGGDYIVIQGNVGPGANVGRGSVNSQNFAAGNLNISQSDVNNGQAQFADLLSELKGLLAMARQTGELDPLLADKAIQNVDETEKLVKEQQPPPKETILRKLQSISEMINAAVEMFTDDKNVASVLLKALPVAVMLVKLAARLF